MISVNIVIIDDDPLVVESLKTIISANNIDILAVGYDGEEAVKLYEKHRPDLILMDIRMEKLNGLEAAKKILKMDPEAKILLITTFQDQEYMAQALSLGCKGYILKYNIKGIIPAIKAVYAGNNKEIAERLYLSEGTVRNYISNMLEKLSLRDRTQLAIYYYKKKYGVED